MGGRDGWMDGCSAARASASIWSCSHPAAKEIFSYGGGGGGGESACL